ncbi:phosphoribosyltransferase [Calothrix sp. UHCC 0171]|uniref:phosphoribosyltransferase n=1 Tax=Calothrix sp. UHCC 0171 TaxID=3110245 RepID=UPI002B1FA62B|nr:phosphoribosyltransferase [Calothrix sp. UHCC 0171]MEA5572460.1 phosphoribosyltransferase [Calothrix sp. UHCC 0171]
MTFIFKNRTHAGQMLAPKLANYAHKPETIVIGLTRGGVPVAYEIAIALNLPLDICIVRKLGVPGSEELAMGAIASDGVMVVNDDIIREFHISQPILDAVIARELRELQHRERVYRGNLPPVNLVNKTVILVDDGIATGSTIRAAIAIIQQEKPKSIIVAVPVAPIEVNQELQTEVDGVVCVITPEPFYNVGLRYEDFSQVTDEEVHYLLERSRARFAEV